MKWDVDLSRVWVFGAKHGGPLAVVDKLVTNPKMLGNEPVQSIDVYETCGTLLATIPLLAKCVSGIGWADDEILVLVLNDGSTLLYDTTGSLINTFLLCNTDTMSDKALIHAIVEGVCTVALSVDMTLYVCEDVNQSTPHISSMRTGLSSMRPATSMVVLAPQFTSSGLLEVVLGTKDNSIVVVDKHGCEDQLLQERLATPVLDMAIAPNGKYLACFMSSGVVSVLSTSFTTKVLDFDTSTYNRPSQMVWCGEDSIVLHWNHFILMIGPYGHWLRFPYSVHLNVVAECDGCRVITSHHCDFLQRVPEPIETIHRIGSTDLAAMLYDAMEAYVDGDPKADENMRSMHPPRQILRAVTTCISAAANEFAPSQQKKYLRAASYGKNFCPFGQFVTSMFVKVSRTLRVLNHLRSEDPGFAISLAQYEALTPIRAVRRLISRGKYSLAARVTEHLGVRFDDILAAWTCAGMKFKIAQGISDGSIRDWVQSHLNVDGYCISGIPLAAAADQLKRRRLANMLLDFEVDMTQQVSFLLNMAEYEVALQQAVNSLEVDTVYLAIRTIDRREASQQAHGSSDAKRRNLTANPMAKRLTCEYYRRASENSIEGSAAFNTLKQLLPTELDAGDIVISSGYRHGALATRLEQMEAGLEKYKAHGKDARFEAGSTEEQISLLKDQYFKLERRFDIGCFVDMSLSETVYNLIALGASQGQHIQVRNDQNIQQGYHEQRDGRHYYNVRMTERHFYYVKIRALAASGQLAALRTFAFEKKSPVGYLPFIEACVSHGHVAECEVYVSRLSSLEEQFEQYVRLKLWRKAADVAFRLKDRGRMQQLRDLGADDKRAVDYVEQLLTKL